MGQKEEFGMAVFDDPKKELDKLQEQLLKDEEWFEKELDSARRMLGDPVSRKNPAGAQAGIPVRRPTAPARPNHRPAPVQEKPKTRGIRGLVTLAALETLGILAVVAYWLLVLLK